MNCKECGGPLDRNGVDEGYVHLSDADDDHVPVVPDPKIKLEWTTSVTEQYETEMSYEELSHFLKDRKEEIPTLEEIGDGSWYIDWSDLGAEFEEDATQMSASVDERELSVSIVKE